YYESRPISSKIHFPLLGEARCTETYREVHVVQAMIIMEGGAVKATDPSKYLEEYDDEDSNVLPHRRDASARKVAPPVVSSSGQLTKLGFTPPCPISGKDALSALQRATSLRCKQEIANLTCLIQQGQFYPTHLPRYCPLDGMFPTYCSHKIYNEKPGRWIGCFDKWKEKSRPGYLDRTNHSSPSNCMKLCLREGFRYAGLVVAGRRCFCTQSLPSDPALPGVEQSKCRHRAVFSTGLPKPLKQPPLMPSIHLPPVRILFLLTVNGRSLRQVLRLISVLYHPRHFFYIHVDARQEYLHRELSRQKLPDSIRLATQRQSTIWGGVSLLQTLLRSIRSALDLGPWDYVINLSESDFPIKPLSHLEQFLAANRGHNFVKSNGRDTHKFISKQGLDKTFHECDAHMWRLGDRELPAGLRVDGGSDWIALTRNFASYVAQGEDALLRGLQTIFNHTLLPAESFFHTALHNSRFCHSVTDNNLHVTNWKRKQGCRCQYKHIVDWCGCSPNDFTTEDWPKLQATLDKPFYFGRKFEPIINQAILNKLEHWITGKKSTQGELYVLPWCPVESYWQNEFHHEDQKTDVDAAYLTAYQSLARLAAQHLACPTSSSKLLEVTLYNHHDKFQGLLVMHRLNSSHHVESFFRPVPHFRKSQVSSRLLGLQIGSQFDAKEGVFRNFAGLLGPFTELVALHRWEPSETAMTVTLVWVDPSNTVAGSFEVRVDANAQMLVHRPGLRQPLRPGVWQLLVLQRWQELGRTSFLVSPLALWRGSALSPRQVLAFHAGPRRPYLDHDFSAVEATLGLRSSPKLRTSISRNARLTGPALHTWIDNLTSEFWTLDSSCIDGYSALSCSNHLSLCNSTSWSSRHIPLPHPS
ncbi:XYLT2, partial [Cordylochernes scorpioides]